MYQERGTFKPSKFLYVRNGSIFSHQNLYILITPIKCAHRGTTYKQEMIKMSTEMDLRSFDRGTNANLVQIGPLTLYFSYRTVVAFRYNGKLRISNNEWGTTTGRHLNTICSDKAIREPHNVVEDALSAIMESIGLEA